MDNQQGPAIEHRELCSMLRGCLDGRRVWGRIDTCMCMAESLPYSLETITTLLIDYTPVQNKKVKKKKKTSPSNARDAGLILELILQLSWSGS